MYHIHLFHLRTTALGSSNCNRATSYYDSGLKLSADNITQK